ncbi:hypothetical protein [Ottowia sp.]
MTLGTPHLAGALRRPPVGASDARLWRVCQALRQRLLGGAKGLKAPVIQA